MIRVNTCVNYANGSQNGKKVEGEKESEESKNTAAPTVM